MIYGFTNTVWENLDILLILNCLDPGQFLGANMAYRFILLMLYDFEVILFKSGSMFNIRISEEKILKILLYRIYSTTSSKYFVYDSINMSSMWLLIAHVAHGPLVNVKWWEKKSNHSSYTRVCDSEISPLNQDSRPRTHVLSLNRWKFLIPHTL